jgi:outer membrane protein assembly factor BamB
VGATLDGRRRAVFFTRRGLVGLDPATGAVAFEREWRSRSDSSVNAATPLVAGNLIFLSASYGTGAAVFSVSKDTLTEVWTSDDVLSNHYATSVHRNGVLYGFHGRQEFGPSFRAVDMKTGAVRWSEEKFRAGTVTLAGDRLLILREGGELVMAEATPEAFRPIARAQVLPAVARGYAALSDGFFYARNGDVRASELICLDLR